MKKASLITDGSCLGNPGPGGWACILRFGPVTKELVHWKRRHWWKKSRPFRNVDLWMELDELLAIHKTTWVWTKGHAAHEDNNRCDWLAQNAARTQTSSWPDGSAHGPLRLNLGPSYIPPKPQASLFDLPDLIDDNDDEDPS